LQDAIAFFTDHRTAIKQLTELEERLAALENDLLTVNFELNESYEIEIAAVTVEPCLN
jgi:hypothetical protein